MKLSEFINTLTTVRNAHDPNYDPEVIVLTDGKDGWEENAYLSVGSSLTRKKGIDGWCELLFIHTFPPLYPIKRFTEPEEIVNSNLIEVDLTKELKL